MRLDAADVTKGSLTVVDHDGIGPSKLVFHFNPTTIQDSHPATWSASKIPGLSHPVYGYGGSGERTLTFTLRFDGDRGRLKRSSSVRGDRPAVNSGLDPLGQILEQTAAAMADRAVAVAGVRRAVGFIKSTNKAVGNILEINNQPLPAVSPGGAERSTFIPSDDPVGLSIQEELEFFRRFSLPGSDGRNVTAPRRVIFNLGRSYRGLECICMVQKIDILSWTPAMEPVRADVAIQLKEFIRQARFRGG